jgi:hypothetical protein
VIQRARHLEHPCGVGVAATVEDQRARQVGRARGHGVDARRKRQPGQIRGQQRAHAQRSEIVPRRRQLRLGRLRQPGRRMHQPLGHLRIGHRDAGRAGEAGDRRAPPDADIPVDDARGNVGDRRRAQHGEAGQIPGRDGASGRGRASECNEN